jgi:hypothetical protein
MTDSTHDSDFRVSEGVNPPGRAVRNVEMPQPTAAPLVLAAGMAMMAAGVPFGLAFFVVGAVVAVVGLSLWIAHLLPGRGHALEVLPEPEGPDRRVHVAEKVEQLRPGLPGYRLRLPTEVHPISAGLRGGIVGGAVMPVPAIIWSLASGNGLWYPVNLLSGMVLPGVGKMTIPELQQFHLTLLFVAVVIHVVMSCVIGLIYGVLLPTLPRIPRAIAWGGLLMPILWTALSYMAMHAANPALPRLVSWPWFVISQFVFGITMPAEVFGAKHLPRVLAGVLGGFVGGLAMVVPAVLWSSAAGHGFWYPINLVAGVFYPYIGDLDVAKIETFHPQFFLVAIAMHTGLCMTFGILFALLSTRLTPIPSPVAWGGLVLPMLWTGATYGLMGVVNPVLQDRVDWPWFILSQFVFGVAAALVVLRSEMVPIPPAGRGPQPLDDHIARPTGGAS